MIWDNPTDVFFSLNSSTGNVEGNKYYTNTVSGNAYATNKIIEHSYLIYIYFRKPTTYRITIYDMSSSVFTSSVQISGKYIDTLSTGKLVKLLLIYSIIDDIYLYFAGYAANNDCYLGKIALSTELGNFTLYYFMYKFIQVTVGN
jgi:hypothetical protein